MAETIERQKSKAPIEITDYQQGKFETGSGVLFDIMNPSWDMIQIDDIALGLSQVIRFGGQIADTYTVAHHSILVARMLPRKYRLAGLLHDASEAYVGDVIKPLKELIGEPYKRIEKRIQTTIELKFGVHMTSEMKTAIKAADLEALRIESEAFQRGDPHPFAITIGDKLPWKMIGSFMDFDHRVVRGLFLVELKLAIRDRAHNEST